MKRLIFISIIVILYSGCSVYTDQYTIQGRWYKDIEYSTKKDVLDFGEHWLLFGIDHGFTTEETDKKSIRYFNNMIYIDSTYYEYKIYGEFLQIWDEEYRREDI